MHIHAMGLGDHGHGYDDISMQSPITLTKSYYFPFSTSKNHTFMESFQDIQARNVAFIGLRMLMGPILLLHYVFN